MTIKLPDVLPGHWTTPEGLEMAQRYAGMRRMEVMAQNQSDMEVANAVFLDPHIMNLTIAKDRIRWLSVQLALVDADKALLLEVARDMAKETCTTFGAEDIEPGCCPSCRARTAIAKATGAA